jgi:hypothetical protein
MTGKKLSPPANPFTKITEKTSPHTQTSLRISFGEKCRLKGMAFAVHIEATGLRAPVICVENRCCGGCI